MDKEKNNELAFLDVQVKRDENKFLTLLYIKKTFKWCCLNFQSNCSLKRKVNLIRTLCHRAHKNFSLRVATKWYQIDQVTIRQKRLTTRVS